MLWIECACLTVSRLEQQLLGFNEGLHTPKEANMFWLREVKETPMLSGVHPYDSEVAQKLQHLSLMQGSYVHPGSDNEHLKNNTTWNEGLVAARQT